MALKISRIFKIASNLCIGLTVLIGLVFAAFTVPRLFGVTPFVVQSSSMEPAIPTGSVVFTNRKDVDVKKGDIITYSLSTGPDSGVFVTHRVAAVDKERGLVRTKGDNNEEADGWLEKTAITGTVLFHVPKAGFVLDTLQNAGFVVLAIWVFAINAVLMLIPHLLDALGEKKDTDGGLEMPPELAGAKIRITSRHGGGEGQNQPERKEET